MGQTFSVTSDDGEEHVRQVASLVDRRMREIAGGGRVVSSFTAAVLAALNIASECQKLRQDVAEIETAIDRLTQRLDGGASPRPQAVVIKERTVRNGCLTGDRRFQVDGRRRSVWWVRATRGSRQGYDSHATIDQQEKSSVGFQLGDGGNGWLDASRRAGELLRVT